MAVAEVQRSVPFVDCWGADWARLVVREAADDGTEVEYARTEAASSVRPWLPAQPHQRRAPLKAGGKCE